MSDDDELRFDGLWEVKLRNRWLLLKRLSPEDRAKDIARAAYKAALERGTVHARTARPNCAR